MKNKSGYYITKNNPTVKFPLEPQEKICLDNMDLIELVLPKCREVYCYYNELTELIIPTGCDYVDCSYNKLTKLIVSKTCKTIWCYNNNLPQIIIDLFESDDPIKMQLANNLQR
jgi:hypothetical protein